MADSDVQVCPGCGGRNFPQAESCDWCGRPFSGRPRSFNLRWWPLAASVLFGGAVAAVVGLSLLNAARPESRPKPTPAAAESPSPAGVAAPAAPASTRAPRAAPSPAPSPTPLAVAPEPAASPEPPRYARVFNTGGLGVNLRKDPGPQGQPLLAVSETAILRLLGPEETVQARVWRLCEHQARGVQGWVPAEYLQPTDQVPTPGRP